MGSTVPDTEYQRFGPWVLEINERDTVPKLFRPYVETTENPILSVKIPRPVERVNAKHLTHRYDYLISLYPTRLVILSRHGDLVVTESVAYSEICSLYSVHDLLRGCLRVVTSSHAYEIPYSTVSSDLMERVIDLIRSFYTESDQAVPVEAATFENGEGLSFFFSNLLDDELRRNPDLRILASQIETPMAAYEVTGWRRAFARVTRRRLLDSLHLTDGRELVVIDRGQPFRYGRQAIYARNTVYLPLSRIASAEWGREAGESPLVTLTIRTGPASYCYRLLATNPWQHRYNSFLRGTTRAQLSSSR